MAEDKRGPQNLSKDDDIVAEDTETKFPSEALDSQTANSSNEGESRDTAVEGILEKSPIGEEMEACVLPELESSAVGDDQEASTSSGSVPNVILEREDLHQAFLSHAKNEFVKFNTIKNNLLDSIKYLKQKDVQIPENCSFLDVLEKIFNETYAIWDIFKDVMLNPESIQSIIKYQIEQCFGSLAEAGEISLGATFNEGTIKGVDVLRSSDCMASVDCMAENVDKSKIAMAVVVYLLKEEKLRLKARAMAEESKMEVSAVAMDADRSAEKPRVMVEAADVNMAEVGDDHKMLPYPITGEYTLTIRAPRQMYQESSSEDSPPENPEQYIQGAGENVGRGVDVIEERMAEDPEDGSSSDSPIE